MNIDTIIQKQRDFAPILAQKPLKYRLDKLGKLRAALKGEWQSALVKAMHKDFGKGEVEVLLSEILPTLDNLKILISKSKSWSKPQKIKTPITLFGSTSYTQVQPKGNTLIISPWNYPIFLTLHPLTSAFAAGNTAVIKPSEHTPHTSEVISQLIASIFDECEACVVQGDRVFSQDLLKRRFDHIFFTGSTEVGKIVMEAASKHLTSVTLELGGKSPTIIDNTANAYAAGQRIAWAKFTNAGQICIAPDHIYVHETKLEDFNKGITEAVSQYYGSDPIHSLDYVKIVNQGHFKRLKNMLEIAQTEGGEMIIGGEYSEEHRKIEPTVIVNPPKHSAMMKEEIFGPLLPVFTFTDLEEPIAEINGREYPLVVYIYSKNKRNIRRIQRRTRAGSTGVNISLLQIANNFLPFGGIGHSGMGKTNGHAGFLEFSNTRSYFYQWGVPINKILSAPYNQRKLAIVKTLLKRFY